MSGRLAGQTAWISGAASGIGAAVSRLFAAEGAQVAMADVQTQRGKSLQHEIEVDGGKALFIQCDVSQPSQIESSIAETVAHFGGLQILVHCAGIVDVKRLDQYEIADWDRLMAVNVRSIYLATRCAMEHLRKHGRSYIVTIGSISSFVGQSATPAYTASKHAVLGLSRSIALDHAVDGVRCNCICPGITDTPMLRYHMSPNLASNLSDRLHRVPLGRVITPEEIARAALYFSCEDSAGITGTSLVIDGGYLTAAEWNRSNVSLPEDLS